MNRLHVAVLVMVLAVMPASAWVDPEWLGLQPAKPDSTPQTTKACSVANYMPVYARKDIFDADCRIRPEAYSFALSDRKWGEPEKLSILAFPDEAVDFRGRRGMAVRVVNRTKAQKSLPTIGGNVDIVQEALTAGNVWEPIERIRQGGCGMVSRDPVSILPGHYCEVASPCFEGPIKVRLRFRLTDYVRDGADVQEIHYHSNSFWGSIHAGQMEMQPSPRYHLEGKPPPSEE